MNLENKIGENVRNMKTLKTFPLIILMLLYPFMICVVNGYDVDVHERLREAFEATYRAESVGGNVDDLVESLNRAINLIEEGERINDEKLKNEALKLIEEVLAEAPKVGEEGRVAAQNLKTQTVITISILTVSAVVVWLFMPRLFWRLWINSRRRWKVKLQ